MDRHPVAYSEIGARARLPAVAGLMKAALENPRLLSLAAGFTDNATLPVAEFTAAAQALAARKGEPEFLQYGNPQGRPELRRLLGERLRFWEPTLPVDGIEARFMITNGSQQALYIAVQSLCDPGDLVLVDRPSYFAFLDVVASLGARTRSLPFDADGRLDMDRLHALLRELKSSGEIRRLKAVYLVTYFSNPSGRCLAEADKVALAEVLAHHGIFVPVMEDVAYRELFYDEPYPARSVLGLPAWERFPKLYLATLTKPFSTGAKVGYGYCSDEAWLRQMLAIKGTHDFGTANYAQALFEEVIGAGGFETHLPRVRRGYRAKMQALHTSLEANGMRELGWHWEQPDGGMYLWLRGPAGIDTVFEGEFFRACVREGVLYVPGDMCFADAPERNWIRASFGVLPAELLAEAGRRLVAVARQFSAK
jgi:2-aminoadipate transaminase